MMGRFNIPEDEPIENRLITNSLEKAQEKIEGFNFDARKHVLEFDDVLNFQRSIVYGKRYKVLSGGSEDVREYLEESANLLEPDKSEKMLSKLGEIFGANDKPELVESLRRLILQTIDMFWVDHLEMMDYLRSSVNLRAYGQRDPLVEYKREGLRFFREMEGSIAEQLAEFVIKLNLEVISAVQASAIEEEAGKITNDQSSISNGPKVGRNDPCPCGSGKKYKHCHGANL
jgi:preprotein translocase subunit SecA